MSNIHFALEELDYFSPATATNLFLHTWSLGVEEQFYIFWPILLALVWRHARNGGGLRNCLTLLVVLSFSLQILLSETRPELAFYLMPTRAWQFSMGALAFLAFNAGPPSWTNWRNQAAAIGLAVTVGAGLLLDGSERYPGYWALIPTIGTTAVLCGPSACATHRMLSLPLLQWLGRRSYSWYLWHWPIFVLASQLVDTTTPIAGAMLVATSLLLASMTFHFIESPIRQSSWLAKHPKGTLAAGLWLVLIAAAGTWWWRSTAESNSEWVRQQGILSMSNEDSESLVGCGNDWFATHGRRNLLCKFGPSSSKRTAVLMGDSVAAQWTPAFKQIFSSADWQLIVNSRFSCPAMEEPFFNRQVMRNYAICANWRKTALEGIAQIHPDVVIISSTDDYRFSPSQWNEGTKKVLESVAPNSGRVILIRATPILPPSVTACGRERSSLHKMVAGSDSCQINLMKVTNSAVYLAQQQAAQQFSNVRIADLNDLICPDEICQAKRGDHLVYRDFNHLDVAFARSLAPELTKRLELPMP